MNEEVDNVDWEKLFRREKSSSVRFGFFSCSPEKQTYGNVDPGEDSSNTPMERDDASFSDRATLPNVKDVDVAIAKAEEISLSGERLSLHERYLVRVCVSPKNEAFQLLDLSHRPLPPELWAEMERAEEEEIKNEGGE